VVLSQVQGQLHFYLPLPSKLIKSILHPRLYLICVGTWERNAMSVRNLHFGRTGEHRSRLPPEHVRQMGRGVRKNKVAQNSRAIKFMFPSH